MRNSKEIKSEMASYSGNKSKKEYRLLKSELAVAEVDEAIEVISSKEDKIIIDEPDSISTIPNGLGDKVAKAIKAVGLDKLVDPDCADCARRKDNLNKFSESMSIRLKRFFHGRKLNEMNDEEYKWLSGFLKDGIPSSISGLDQKKVHAIYFSVTGIRKQNTNCPPCLIKVIKALELLVEQKQSK
jgi:hypothetical protein